jgi:hypothetical protein
MVGNRRFEHRSCEQPDFSMIDDQLRRMIAAEANPAYRPATDLTESVNAIIHAVDANAATMKSLLVGLKRKVSQ